MANKATQALKRQTNSMTDSNQPTEPTSLKFQRKTRLQTRSRKDHAGTFVFGTGEEYAESQAAGTIENRDNVVQLRIGNELQATRAYDGGRSNKAHCTYKEMIAEAWDEQWTPEIFNMLD